MSDTLKQKFDAIFEKQFCYGSSPYKEERDFWESNRDAIWEEIEREILKQEER